jgi:hypothetical protein
MQRPLRSYGPPRRRLTLIVAGVFLASVALLAARLRQDTEQRPSLEEIFRRIESEQRLTSGGQEPRVSVTFQAGADVSAEDVAGCQASGRIVVVRLSELSETASPEALCVEPKQLEALPRLPRLALAP